jgi:hypothetical protein
VTKNERKCFHKCLKNEDFSFEIYTEKTVHGLSDTPISSLLIPLLQEVTCYSLIDVDNLDVEANIMHARLLITSPSDTFLHLHINST